jgi:hypothetical protein
MVPTFTRSSIGQGGAQLYSGSIATPTPQAFNVASPPEAEPGFGVDPPIQGRPGHALHTGPYPPGLSRLNAYGASTTGSLSLHLLTSLDGPAPSGSPGTSRRCRGRLPPSPAFPGSGCPQLHQTAATAGRCRPFTSTRLRGTCPVANDLVRSTGCDQRRARSIETPRRRKSQSVWSARAVRRTPWSKCSTG